MYLLIVFLPLLSFLTLATMGNIVGRRGSTILSTITIIITALLSTIAYYEVGIGSSPCYVEIAT